MTWNLYDCHSIPRHIECPQQLSASDPACKGCRYAGPSTVESVKWRERWRKATTGPSINGTWIKTQVRKGEAKK